MKLKLVKVNDAYIKQIHAFRDEMLQANSSMDGTGPLRRFRDIHDWIDFSNQCANKQTVPDGLVHRSFCYSVSFINSSKLSHPFPSFTAVSASSNFFKSFRSA